MKILHYIGSSGGAVFVTTGLGLIMASMIAVEFKAQDKLENTSFEINPTGEDVKVVTRKAKIDKVKTVIPPPPPPQIDRQPAVQPTEAIASLEGAIPIFEPPKIEGKIFNIALSDRDPQPLVRIPPIMPPRAERSGHCKVRFDVSPEGQPFNVATTYCTQGLFERVSIKSVQKWKYNPKIVDGRSVSRSGVESKITFRLTDERGKIIPE